MISAFIISSFLGINLYFTDTPKKYCQTQSDVNGCYLVDDNTIYLNVYGDNYEKTLYHELGHALYYGNENMDNMVKDLAPLTAGDTTTAEKVADYYAEFMTNPENFKTKYPELYNVFNDNYNVLKYFIG